MRLLSSTAKAREAAAARLPSLRLGAGYTRLSEVPPFAVTLPGAPEPIVVSENFFNAWNLRLSVEQPLFTGFRLQAGTESARLLERSAGQDLAKDRSELVFSIKAAYWGLARARELAAVVEETIGQVGEHLKDVRAFYDQGLLTRNEVLRTELQLANAELMGIDARAAVEVARTSLCTLLGLPLDAGLELTTTAESQASRAPDADLGGDAESARRLVETALDSRPEIRSADLRVQASEAGLRAARSGRYPQVFLAGNYYYLRPNARFMPAEDRFHGTWDVALSVSFDVWNWGRTKSQAEQAKAQLAQARDARALLEDAAVLDVTQSRLALAQARDKIRVAGQAVGQAEENLRVFRERFRQGVALNSEVIDAELVLFQTKAARAQAAIDLVLAQARLEKALGN
jgi:outer membrane protein TolC